jgi:hypothetical protein
MKHLGLFLLVISSSVWAGTSANLHLRAVVPASYEVKIEMSENGPVAFIKTNVRKNGILPKHKIVKRESNYLISVFHP